jgi:hypothetical protein
MTTDNEYYTFPQGFWRVGTKKFINKHEAFLYATEINLPIQKSDYVYFNHVWEQFDRSLIGKFTLKELYKQRAQQLRDSYDYLILYFSGGSDSYNILRSFIDNGIKLDEVCVKWNTPAIETMTNIYIPNTTINTAFNCISEWDFAIKPVLEKLAIEHPEINIEIIDWFKSKDTISLEDAFKLVNHWHDVEVPSLAMWSPSENKMLEKGKTVASIYGIDKPCLFEEDGNYYMRFTDAALCAGTPNPNNIYGTEYFYWTPKFPILAFEMANQLIKSYKTPQFKWLRQHQVSIENWRTIDHIATHQIFETAMRHILYDTWENRFQSNKPLKIDRSDKNFWIYQNSELSSYKENYSGLYNEYLKPIRSSENQSWSLTLQRDGIKGYKRCETKNFFVLRNI